MAYVSKINKSTKQAKAFTKQNTAILYKINQQKLNKKDR